MVRDVPSWLAVDEERVSVVGGAGRGQGLVGRDGVLVGSWGRGADGFGAGDVPVQEGLTGDAGVSVGDVGVDEEVAVGCCV